MKKLKKVTYKLEVLMPVEDSPDESMENVAYEVIQGGWSGGGLNVDKTEIIEGDEAVEKACGEQGTDAEFFFPLAEDDKFECDVCHGTFDIEDSFEIEDRKLLCPKCAGKAD